MPCYHPLPAWKSPHTGRLTFKASPNVIREQWEPLLIPCGQCVGCRLERSRQWAMRCVHEASLHQENCFLTLTYSNDHLPADGSINKRDFQLFMKRLRKDEDFKTIKYYMCGEYGDTTFRPHYHVLLFGHDYPDKTLFKYSDGPDRDPLFISSTLDEQWKLGQCTIGRVSFKTAAYTARYVMKKRNGPDAKKHYGNRMPEFTLMSRRPGIGHGWFARFHGDVYPHDFTVLDNRKLKPPKFYDTLYEEYGGDLDAIKAARKEANQTDEEEHLKRLEIKEYIQLRKLKDLKRQL